MTKIKIVLRVFSKTFIFEANCPFWFQKWCVTISPHLLWECFWMLHIEKSKRITSKSCKWFSRNNPNMTCTSGSTLKKITTTTTKVPPIMKIHWWDPPSKKIFRKKRIGENYQEIVEICFHWYLKKSNTGVTDINSSTESVIYWMQFHWVYKWEISKK